ncbi:hypothetical protein RND71_036388 [Anisodus tanguticus]|uniref:H(+)-exporting diphosphatase n=1 Tax=Anisodus tanguticus TaxID=243964 RepID=A0AAE1R219_9SOLA|nr:hypothetical protein RND71_036388 [Anisodus tanguticus]
MYKELYLVSFANLKLQEMWCNSRRESSGAQMSNCPRENMTDMLEDILLSFLSTVQLKLVWVGSRLGLNFDVRTQLNFTSGYCPGLTGNKVVLERADFVPSEVIPTAVKRVIKCVLEIEVKGAWKEGHEWAGMAWIAYMKSGIKVAAARRSLKVTSKLHAEVHAFEYAVKWATLGCNGSNHFTRSRNGDSDSGVCSHRYRIRVSTMGDGGKNNGYSEALIEEEEGINDHSVVHKCAEIQNAISEAQRTRRTYDSSRMCKPALATAVFSTISFLLGAVTSVISGFLGMKIATYANARTTLESRKGLGKAFIVAFRSGAVMGFLLAANGLLSMGLFGRVGGGIYTKAADVGADLVGKVERNIPEDDPRNPAVIADNVGDNVGDIAGMGSDLFGSYAESSCAALVVASISSFGVNHEFTAMLYPLLISSVGILVCLLTTLFATDFFEVKAVKEIEPALKKQLVISTVLMTIGIALVSWIALPSTFTIFNFGIQKEVQSWQLFLCVGVGLWAGLIIGFITDTIPAMLTGKLGPVQDVADSCRTGAATNVIFHLPLGYKSVIVPIFAIAISIFVSFSFAAMYGIAVAALGMLSTIATGLAIDAYGPISDNAGGIAEMAGMSHRIRERTDALDAAGNTTAAIGKGFAIGSAALVSLALFGAFVSRAGISTVDVLTPKVFIGLLVGAMLPYWFSAMTMKSVGSAALKMVEEVRRQFNTIPGLMEGTAKPEYANCVKISTDASIKEMIPPGILFDVETLSGVFVGSLVSSEQIAISASNTGGAWDNAKKYIEAGASEHARTLGPKGSGPHKAVVIGDTVGDPFKDTFGSSLNILIKLVAVKSLVFATFFATHGGLLFKIF